MRHRSWLAEHGGEIAVVALIAAALYATSLQNYLLFQSLIELFTILVATGIFVIAWNARAYIHNNYILLIGIASIFAAFVDVVHVLAYPGLSVLPGDGRNLSTQLWLAARFLRTASWLIAPLLLGRRLRPWLQALIFLVATAFLLLCIAVWKVFPAAYIPGSGFTAFDLVAEYAVSGLLVVAAGLLLLKRRDFDSSVLRLLFASLLLTALAEVLFTLEPGSNAPTATAGHLVRFVAYYLLYKAVIETGLLKPYSLLLRDLKQTDERRRQYAAALEEQNQDLQLAQDEMRLDAASLTSQNLDLRRTQDQMRDDAAALVSRNLGLLRSQNSIRRTAAALQSEKQDLIRDRDQMRQDATVLKAQNDELDAFAHTVAHDLKDPLAVIIATGDLVDRVPDLTESELREFFQQVRATALELNGIIDSLLLLAEVRKGDAPCQPVDMAAVVENVIVRLSPQIKDTRTRLTLPEHWPTAVGYGPWIEEVWANYIGNALKYGGPSPSIELGASIESDGMVRFWTRDEGPGIQPQDREALFTPFAQRPLSARRGHGLGLSIVLRIVDRLGGQVGVQSRDGKGSEFFFTLPVAA